MLLFANGARGGEVLPAKCFSLFSICKPKWDGWRSSANRCSRHRVSPSDKTCQKGAEARRKNSPHLQSKHLKCQGPSSYGGGGGNLGKASAVCSLLLLGMQPGSVLYQSHAVSTWQGTVAANGATALSALVSQCQAVGSHP